MTTLEPEMSGVHETDEQAGMTFSCSPSTHRINRALENSILQTQQ